MAKFFAFVVFAILAISVLHNSVMASQGSYLANKTRRGPGSLKRFRDLKYGTAQVIPTCGKKTYAFCAQPCPATAFAPAFAPVPLVPTDDAVNINNIFILAGQSNMAGRGGIINSTCWDACTPPQCKSDPRILRLSCEGKWEVAREPIHQDVDNEKACGVGPGLPFAHSLLERFSSIGVVGLVPCAIGGTKITQWGVGSINYERLVDRARQVLKAGGQIRAMLWYQGEEDSKDEQDALHYKERLESFINNVRSNLSLPMLPVIQVALASVAKHGHGNFTHIIRDAQLKLKLPNVVTVDAWGLNIQPTDFDEVHLSTASQVQLGQMLADVYIKNFL